MSPSKDAIKAVEHVATLKRTFGNEPTWGMVEMAYRAGYYEGQNEGHKQGSQEVATG